MRVLYSAMLFTGRILVSLGSLYVMQMKPSEAEVCLRQAKQCMRRCECAMGASQVLFNKAVLRLGDASLTSDWLFIVTHLWLS